MGKKKIQNCRYCNQTEGHSVGCPGEAADNPHARLELDLRLREFTEGRTFKQVGYEPSDLKERSLSWLLGYNLTPARQ
jgi:hypothetical protein